MILISSLKYSPVFKSHCTAFGKMCEKNGYSIKYLYSCNYKWMLNEELIKKSSFIGDSKNLFGMLITSINPKNFFLLNGMFRNDRPKIIYMHNYHFLNHYIASKSKKYGTKFIYHVHEPYVENKKYHGVLLHYWLYLFEFLQKKLLENTDVAIISSDEALSLFRDHYPMYKGRINKIPLIYEDLNIISEKPKRRYITFIGPPVPAKGPGIFLKIAEYCEIYDKNLKFLLITNSNIKDSRYNKDNLKIYYHNRISDEQFGDLIKQSLVVITPYLRETQSSSVLVSYMYGTPVLSSNVGGLKECVMHKKTGYMLDMNARIEDWYEGLQYIISNNSILSENCRAYFNNNFSENNWNKYLSKLIT